MFGYIIVHKPELKVREYETYKASYCGLCRSLKKRHGRIGQMTLSYDMTFLALLLTGLYEPETITGCERCIAHPVNRHHFRQNQYFDYAADMNVLLTFYKCLDDWQDEKNYPKHVISIMLKKDYARISRKYPRQVEAVEAYMRKLNMLESKRETNLDAIAGLTGEMLGEIFSWKDDIWAEELHCLGFYMGKFIYLMDAYEDLEKDLRKKEYNPFEAMVKNNPKDFDTLSKLILTSMMSECSKSFERLPILRHASIIRNILYSGVWSKYEYVQAKKKKRRKSQ